MPPQTQVVFLSASTPEPKSAALRLIVGEKLQIKSYSHLAVLGVSGDFLAPIKDDTVDTLTTFVGNGPGKQNDRNRNAPIIRADILYETVTKIVQSVTGSIHITVLVENEAQAFSAGTAVARAFPIYSKKTKGVSNDIRTVWIDLLVKGSQMVGSEEVQKIQIVADAVRNAARLVDTPPSELHTDAYLSEIQTIATNLASNGVTIKVIRGDELVAGGFGGIFNVGRGADRPPFLAILSFAPKGAKSSLAFVGKGIIFDTGGINLKGREHILGMKIDMGGSAACLMAFEALVKMGYKETLHCVMCVAENAIGAHSYLPDAILTLHSGLTVEINNTDAEGRLVLADGVSYASRVLNPDYMFDMATLTGAQSYATGNKHGGVLAPKEDVEKLVVEAGKRAGEAAWPLLYAPEYVGVALQFSSTVADMKNSVKDRSNLASSAAGHFIEEHIDPTWREQGNWAHIDMAAPVTVTGGCSDRASGWGVGLLVEVAKTVSKKITRKIVHQILVQNPPPGHCDVSIVDVHPASFNPSMLTLLVRTGKVQTHVGVGGTGTRLEVDSWKGSRSKERGRRER
ncbi:putative aminopeptidase npepl1 [Gonapodya sp. JEL0774]|nr:putative aminopeptidase npepl1 [Gonapodya sp. JEL0774]